jgi:RNA polymerase sigma-70 factor (ECF subfamily)
MDSDDRQLLQQVTQGNQRALEQLYARYRLRVWRYLWYRLDGNAGLVEELLQEVFFSVWRSAKQYRGEAQVETWIIRITHHLLLNAQRRKRSISRGYGVEEEASLSYEHIASQLKQSYEEQVLERILLEESMHKLSHKHREVLELVFHYGFSCEEVAQILDVPPGTIKSRISFARRKLFEEITTAQALGRGDRS